MDYKSRVEAAIRHLPVDRVPCAELIINDAVIKSLCGTEDVGFEQRLHFIRSMGLDAVCLHPECADYGPNGLPLPNKLIFPDMEKWAGTNYYLFAVLDGPVGWGTRVLGFTELLTELMRRSPDVLQFMAAVENLNAETMNQLAASGINGIIIADDIAFNQGVIVRPSVLRQLLFPSLARNVAHAKRLGLSVFFHSDGNLSAVLDDIVMAGFTGLQCIEELAGMDIESVKKNYGEKLCLWGNLDPSVLFAEYHNNELQHKVHSIIAKAGCGSGLIFGTSSGLFDGMRLDNLRMVYQTARGIQIPGGP